MESFESLTPDIPKEEQFRENLPQRDKIEDDLTNTEKPENKIETEPEEKQRLKWVETFSHSLKRIFREITGKPSPEELLRQDLINREIIGEADMLDADKEMLETELHDFYRTKYEIALRQPELREKMSWDNVCRLDYIQELTREEQDEVIKFRKELDSLVSDEQTTAWRREIEFAEELKIENEKRQKIINEWKSFIGAMREGDNKYEETRQNRINKQEEIKRDEFYEIVLEHEKINLETVQKITAKNPEEINERDLWEFKNWLYFHREFGLNEMDEDEFYSFFANGKFYVHSTPFFQYKGVVGGEARAELIPGGFVETLKDGYLISRKVGQERGETISGTAVAERTVVFDSQYDFTAGKTGHLPYAEQFNRRVRIENCPPIVLISPANLLEAHSVKSPFIKGQKIGIAEGEHFGSSNENPENKAHEIDLSLFVMVCPDINADVNFIKNFIENLQGDSRFNQSEEIKRKLDSISKTAEQNKDKEIPLKELMVDFISEIKKQGRGVPRLFFYKLDESGGSSVTKKGFTDFTQNNEIKIDATVPEEVSSHYRKKDLKFDDVRYENLPEKFRIPRSEMEETANKVRHLLKVKR